MEATDTADRSGPVRLPRDDAAIQPAELAKFVGRPESQRIHRLEGDYQLMLELSLSEFAGPAWERVADALAAYGYAVIGAWTRTGTIFSKCQEKRIPIVNPPTRRLNDHDVEDLVADTVAAATIHFRDHVLRPQRWHPSKGASLSTYFIGNCLLQFPNQYRSWRAFRAGRSTPISDTTDTIDYDTPEHSLMTTETVRELLADVADPITREIVGLQAEGFSQVEIAETLGISVGAVESRLYHLRQKSA